MNNSRRECPLFVAVRDIVYTRLIPQVPTLAEMEDSEVNQSDQLELSGVRRFTR